MAPWMRAGPSCLLSGCCHSCSFILLLLEPRLEGSGDRDFQAIVRLFVPRVMIMCRFSYYTLETHRQCGRHVMQRGRVREQLLCFRSFLCSNPLPEDHDAAIDARSVTPEGMTGERIQKYNKNTNQNSAEWVMCKPVDSF